ncbi:hypothetical protein BDB00DRAFT_935978 [Zychaea mexicana]|uniref:uncharacterized protein n=1 Tax=Zychaea mexicana TaxID=64656 RepID=UPI0022FDCA60|nr:uncharacterized protein BDB00DRAFT_935978 [Zychaea mexicana]KAI9497941.1 hypothetical protein BDB00DRAFT_935978 [Zychaea mexicana]
MGGIPIQALVALIMTLIKMCLAGGIGYAISEYKWIKLEHGSKLSLLDVYDAITRGIGGIIRVLMGIRPDLIIVPGIIMQLGLIAMGPSSQQILTAYPTSYCEYQDVLGRYTNLLQNETIASWDLDTRDIRSLRGTIANYLLQMAMAGTAQSWNIPMSDLCPASAANCTIEAIPIVYNVVRCSPGSFNETLVVSEQDRSVKTVQEYYNYTDGEDYQTLPHAPNFLYGGNMQYRTTYDLGNYTQAIQAGGEGGGGGGGGGATTTNDSTTAPQPVPPAGTAFAGEQTLVAISHLGTASPWLVRGSEIAVHECTLVPYLNRTTFIFLERGGGLLDYLETTPIEMDYALLSNASHWNNLDNLSDQDRIMVNAYGLQVAELTYLIDQNMKEFNDDVSTMWSVKNSDNDTIENFLQDLVYRMDRIVVFGRPEGAYSVGGMVCYDLPTQYHVDPAAYYTLSLCLLIPMFWWVVVWILALYRSDGVSRGNSQVVLLVTGLTAALRRQLKGMSHASVNDIFERAKKTNVKFV